jgi:uncharacterized protein
LDHSNYDDEYIADILNKAKTIAVVGASDNPVRPSYFVMKYMKKKGYQIIPVNPGKAGSEILGCPVYASLLDIPETVDIVDCFRGSDAIPPIADEAIRIGAKILWMQLGISNEEAAKTAETAGLKVVMNRCPKIEYGRLSGEIGYMGVSSGIISNKRKKMITRDKR